MVLSYLYEHRLRGGELSGKTLWLWPHSSISTESRKFKAFVSASRMGVKRLRSEDKILEWRSWWEQSVFTERRWREVTVVQLSTSDKPGEMTAFWAQLIWTKKLFISIYIKARVTLKCSWHTCWSLFIFIPTIPIILVDFHLYVFIIIKYLSNFSFEYH